MSNKNSEKILKMFNKYYKSLKDPMHLEEKLKSKKPEVAEDVFAELFPNFPYKLMEIIKGKVSDYELLKLLIIYGKADYYYKHLNSGFF